jgi:hypothetical protein
LGGFKVKKERRKRDAGMINETGSWKEPLERIFG